jgi:two-component system sensor histidine kinase AlgZ
LYEQPFAIGPGKYSADKNQERVDLKMTLHKKQELLLHTAFWAVYASFIVNHITSYQTGTPIHWGHVILASLISVSYLLVLSYFNYFFLIPVFLLRRKPGAYILFFLASLVTLVALRVGAETLAFGRSWEARNLARIQLMVQSTISDLFIVLFIALLRFAFEWPALDSRRRQLETEKLHAEIKFLKAQVNPHFLFNTLNNLYYLSTIKSDTAPLVIAKLSEVMRYMIYDSNHEQIALHKEIEYMQHYISLERLRVKEGIPLEFEVTGPTDMFISPLILITFLENAFKHGVSNGGDHCWIKALLRVDDTRLLYTIANSKTQTLPYPDDGKGIGPVDGEGIGLANVKRRLNLSYPGKHQLHIDDREDSYSVTLTIDRL